MKNYLPPYKLGLIPINTASLFLSKAEFSKTVLLLICAEQLACSQANESHAQACYDHYPSYKALMLCTYYYSHV